MRPLFQCTLAALVLLGAAGCGGDSATKTVTVAGEPVTPTQRADAPAQTPDASGADAKSKSAGPALPAGVIGVDGRYLLKTASNVSNYKGSDIARDRFLFYEEKSTAVTKCVGQRCEVAFRLGLKSGGSKAYTLRADPKRERTYVGTAAGQIKCPYDSDTKFPSRERIAVRAGSPTKIGDRQVAGRLSLYATITARCTNGAEDPVMSRSVYTLRGPREPE